VLLAADWSPVLLAADRWPVLLAADRWPVLLAADRQPSACLAFAGAVLEITHSIARVTSVGMLISASIVILAEASFESDEWRLRSPD
jgi:hypothetical protein